MHCWLSLLVRFYGDWTSDQILQSELSHHEFVLHLCFSLLVAGVYTVITSITKYNPSQINAAVGGLHELHASAWAVRVVTYSTSKLAVARTGKYNAPLSCSLGNCSWYIQVIECYTTVGMCCVSYWACLKHSLSHGYKYDRWTVVSVYWCIDRANRNVWLVSWLLFAAVYPGSHIVCFNNPVIGDKRLRWTTIGKSIIGLKCLSLVSAVRRYCCPTSDDISTRFSHAASIRRQSYELIRWRISWIGHLPLRQKQVWIYQLPASPSISSINLLLSSLFASLITSPSRVTTSK